LADPESKIIAAYGVLNPQAKDMMKGMALPGYFYVDASGVIREKYFQANFTDRVTANNLMGKLFPELTEEVTQKVDAPHLSVQLGQSDRALIPGSLFTLKVQVALPPDVHVYAPGVTGYKPIQLELSPAPEIEIGAPVYPPSKLLYLDAIKEQVPVFEGNFNITSELKISADPTFLKSPGENGRNIAIAGNLRYQACDKSTCYLPTSIPLTWKIQILALDRQRSPEAIQHR
jgi:hypothetical protein